MSYLVGQQIEQYRIDAMLGQGGMGAVYRAFDLNLARPVALKITHPHLSEQASFKERFMQEARAAARLKHPSIVDVHDFGTYDNMLYMVMDYVSGGSLGDYLRTLGESGQHIALSETLEMLAQVADALGFADRQGVVHRDIKPDNVLLEKLETSDGTFPFRAVVTDFGLAKLLEGGINTGSDAFMGTLPYMSPEQTLGGEVDGRSDLYAVGVILYQLATGRLPFEMKSPTDAVVKHMKATPVAPRDIHPTLPLKVDAIVRRSIAKEPSQRFKSGTHLARALRAAAKDLSTSQLAEYAPPESVYSIMTELESQPPTFPPSSDDADLTTGSSSGQYYLILVRKDKEAQRIPLEGLELTLGRSHKSDIVLDASGISRYHARLERTMDGWQVQDLGSTNGTFIGKNRLAPKAPEPWESARVLRIGPYYMRWELVAAGGTEDAAAPEVEAGSGQRGVTEARSDDDSVKILVNPTTVDIKPGERIPVNLELTNLGLTVTQYTLAAQGVSEEWLTLPAGPIQLVPGMRESVQIFVHPPRSSQAVARKHPYRLVLTSSNDSETEIVVSGTISIDPFISYTIELRPPQLIDGEEARLLIRNEGNTAINVSVEGHDPGANIDFELPQEPQLIGPGEQEPLPILLRSRQSRPLFSTPQQIPYAINVTADNGETRNLEGLLQINPELPRWLPPI